jgi:hypothetical protein
LELVGSIADELPTANDRQLSRTLPHSIDLLTPQALDFLAKASFLAAAPIPVNFVAAIAREVDHVPTGGERRDHHR